MPRPSRASQEAAGAIHKIFDKTYIQPDLCFAVSKEFALNLESKPHSSAVMYVDDVWGVSSEKDAAGDMAAVTKKVENLFC